MNKELLLNYWLQDGRHGHFMTITGPPRKGKTNVACLLIEHLLDMDFDIITTIRIKDPPKRIYHVAWFSQFLRTYAEDIRNDSVFVVDDAQSSMGTSLNVGSKKSQQNTTLLIYIGKFKMNIIYVAHIKDYIPKNIHGMIPLEIKVENRGEMRILGRKVPDVPKTKLDFETFSISHWDYDVNIDRLYAELTMVSEDETKNTILKFLNDKDNNSESYLTNTEKAKVILEFLGNDIGKKYTKSDIARKLNVDRSLITKVQKKYYNK